MPIQVSPDLTSLKTIATTTMVISHSNSLSCVFSGTINNKVVPKSGLLDPAHCTDSPEWSIGFPGVVCDDTIDFHRLSLNKPLPTSLEGKDIILSNQFGTKSCTLSVTCVAITINLSDRTVCNI